MDLATEVKFSVAVFIHFHLVNLQKDCLILVGNYSKNVHLFLLLLFFQSTEKFHSNRVRRPNKYKQAPPEGVKILIDYTSEVGSFPVGCEE